MRKVLVVTYHWPPAGGPGVQRVLKFVKYLPQLNWQPVILTVKNGEYPAIDYTLEKDIPKNTPVYRTSSFNPAVLYKRFVGLKSDQQIPTAVLAEKQSNWKKKLAAWLRLNLFVPDAKRGWQNSAVKEGLKIIKKEQPDLIFSSSPPPTTHLIARQLAQKSKLRWVADFRDPWTNIHYYENQPRLEIVKRYDRFLEQNVLESAHNIICISQLDIDHDFGEKVAKEKCINIPNGYDEEDFNDLPVVKNDFKGFILMHLGAIGKERIPVNVIKSIQKLNHEGLISPLNFRFTCIGNIERGLTELIREMQVDSFFQHIMYLPHKEAIAHSMTASAMLLLITQSQKNKRILPGKTFEYIRTAKPILALGPEDGEVARILKAGNFGKIINYDDFNSVYNYLKQLITTPINEGMDKSEIAKYERKALTEDLSTIFNQLVN
jgi:Glycosyltransferase Family 4